MTTTDGTQYPLHLGHIGQYQFSLINFCFHVVN